MFKCSNSSSAVGICELDIHEANQWMKMAQEG